MLLIVLIVFISPLNTTQNCNSNKDENLISSFRFEKIKENSLIISGPISINDAQDWIDLKNQGKCFGQGTQIDPYIIRNLKINGNGLICIGISLVRDVYYKIMNCELYNGSYGIKITYADMGDIIGNNISYNTYGIDTFISPPFPTNKLISDNLISYNEDGGITCIPLYDCEISNNIITYNGHHGIYLADHNERVDILNNNISNNYGIGLFLISFDYGTIQENIINYNERGIDLRSSDSNTFIENSINYNKKSGVSSMDNNAIAIYGSNLNSIINNEITDNGKYEFYFSGSNDTLISNNLIIESYSSYFYETGECSGNQFIDNVILYDDIFEYNDFFYDAYQLSNLDFEFKSLKAIDDDWFKIFLEYNNTYEISINCSEIDEVLDLYLYDSNQNIIKFENSELYFKVVIINATTTDFYYIQVYNGINNNYSLGIHPYQEPLQPNPPEIIINSPISGEIMGNSAPSYNLSIIGDFDITWYTLDDGLTNITASGLTGTISQTQWDKKGNGIVTIKFYVNNSVGLIDSAEVDVEKYVSEESISSTIPGYDFITIIAILSAITLILAKKKVAT